LYENVHLAQNYEDWEAEAKKQGKKLTRREATAIHYEMRPLNKRQQRQPYVDDPTTSEFDSFMSHQREKLKQGRLALEERRRQVDLINRRLIRGRKK
jgi:hypothetical protein